MTFRVSFPTNFALLPRHPLSSAPLLRSPQTQPLPVASYCQSPRASLHLQRSLYRRKRMKKRGRSRCQARLHSFILPLDEGNPHSLLPLLLATHTRTHKHTRAHTPLCVAGWPTRRTQGHTLFPSPLFFLSLLSLFLSFFSLFSLFSLSLLSA